MAELLYVMLQLPHAAPGRLKCRGCLILRRQA
jgi:hypothetical protein